MLPLAKLEFYFFNPGESSSPLPLSEPKLNVFVLLLPNAFGFAVFAGTLRVLRFYIELIVSNLKTLFRELIVLRREN